MKTFHLAGGLFCLKLVKEADQMFRTAAGEDFLSTKLQDSNRTSLSLVGGFGCSEPLACVTEIHSSSTACTVTKVKENMDPNKVINQ